MSEDVTAPSPSTYRVLGLVDNPFPSIDPDAAEPYWQRVVTHAAADRLLAGIARARANSKPVMMFQAEPIPDYYPRFALNQVLRTTAVDAGLNTLVINSTIDVMRLGTIRGPLAAVVERVAAMNLPLTVGLYFAEALKAADQSLPEAAALEPGQIEAVAKAFAAAPVATMNRYLGTRPGDWVPSRDEEFDALHDTYVRGVHLEKSPDEEVDRARESDELDDAPAEAPVPEREVVEEAEPEKVDPDEAMREYLLAVLSTQLSPVVSRALAKYRGYGESMVAQELKVTKAPRKTLEAVLALAHARWGTFVFLWGEFDGWVNLDQQTKLDVMAALNELRWIFGKYGVMGLTLSAGVAPELEEVFAAAEHVDWGMPGLAALYEGDAAWNGELVQSWIDSASVQLPAAVRVDGPEMAPIVSAANGDVLAFALIAEVAFRDAVSRGVDHLDAAAVSAALASVRVEDGA